MVLLDGLDNSLPLVLANSALIKDVDSITKQQQLGECTSL